MRLLTYILVVIAYVAILSALFLLGGCASNTLAEEGCFSQKPKGYCKHGKLYLIKKDNTVQEICCKE